MPKLFVINREGTEIVIDGAVGQSVMQLVRNECDDLLALCGGSCSCATCHVYVDPSYADKLPPLGPTEDELLGMTEHRRSTSRLSCQIPFQEALDGLRVTIAPDD